jgi:hypothetical protein
MTMNIRRTPIVGLIVAVGMLAGGACRRSKSGDTAEAANIPACIETNTRAGIAAACMACLEKNAIEGPEKDGCCGIKDPMGKQLCDAVAACMRAGGPPVGSCNVAGDTSKCYCGTNQAGCHLDGRPNGPCATLVTAAAGRNIETGTTDKPNGTDIIHRYGDVKYALGRASNIAAIAGAYCKIECETGM